MSLNKNENFSHLTEIKPEVNDIINTPVEFIDAQHLTTLSDHFKDIKEKNYLDIEIVNATNNILSKIDTIINLGSNKISGEVMKASNDNNYSQAA